MNDKKIKTLKIILSALAMLAVMAFIFLLSSQTGEESSHSSDVVEDIIDSLPGQPGNSDGQGSAGGSGNSSGNDPFLLFGQFNIRKSAHIFLYFALGVTTFLFSAALIRYFRSLNLSSPAFSALAAGAICFLYACSDEWHQKYVDGRTALMSDVGIDAIGFCSAIALCFIIYMIIAYIKRTPDKK